MRIVGGEFRGRRLAAIGKGDAGAHLRPTTDRTRESLFNILTGGKFDIELDGARVLDLFAGSGALGLEALSRGAVHVTFVDSGRAAQKLVRENVSTLGVRDRTKLLICDVAKLPATDAAVDLIFLDPPYGKSLIAPSLARTASQGWVGPETLIVAEDNERANADGLTILDQRRMGETWLTFLRLT